MVSGKTLAALAMAGGSTAIAHNMVTRPVDASLFLTDIDRNGVLELVMVQESPLNKVAKNYLPNQRTVDVTSLPFGKSELLRANAESENVYSVEMNGKIYQFSIPERVLADFR